MKAKGKMLLSFIIVAILVGVAANSQTVGPTGVIDFPWLNGTSLNVGQVFINSVNYTSNIVSGSGESGDNYLWKNGTNPLTGDWDAQQGIDATWIDTSEGYYLEDENYTDIFIQGVKVSHIANSAPELETIIEGLANNTRVEIIANWTGSSSASIQLPNEASGIDVTITGLGRLTTELQGETDVATFGSDSTTWGAIDNYLRVFDIEVSADSDYTLNAAFWHTTVENAIVNIDANSNSKGIILGGAGADAPPSTWKDVLINHRSGVTTNAIMRIWLESFVGININIVLKSNPTVDIGAVFELLGTSSTFIKTNIH